MNTIAASKGSQGAGEVDLDRDGKPDTVGTGAGAKADPFGIRG